MFDTLASGHFARILSKIYVFSIELSHVGATCVRLRQVMIEKYCSLCRFAFYYLKKDKFELLDCLE